MKSVKRFVDTSFWEDEKVVEAFSPEDKYFYLYLLTNPHTTQLGIYRLVPKTAAFELGYSKEAVIVLLERFETKYDMIRYNVETSEVAIKNYLRHSIVKGGKPVMDCLLKEESMVDDKSLLVYIYNHIHTKDNLNNTVIEYMDHLREYINDNDNENERYVHVSYHDTSTIRPRYVNESYHDTSTNRQTSQESHETGKNFIPPTIEEVEKYCQENHLDSVNAESFVYFYGSKGWMVGKNKMKDWHKAVSGWNSRNKGNSKSASFNREAWLNS